MLTRIEIDGFKTFERFALDLQPFTAIVGPNASGKSNLFDALRFLSLLAQNDIRTAMQDLRGEPAELFRKTNQGSRDRIVFAIEVLLASNGTDAFGTKYSIKSQRLRYELEISQKYDANGHVRGIYVTREHCEAIPKKSERAQFLKSLGSLHYSGQLNPFIRMRGREGVGNEAIEIRQDGEKKRGRPVTLPANEASRTALSTVTTAEFPHLYALRDLLGFTRFLEINPQAARTPSDRFEDRILKPDASNLSAVLAKLRDETCSDVRPDGVLSDISADLASLIPSVSAVTVNNDPSSKEYSFGLTLTDELTFSSRVISDGTLRLLALLTVLNDPSRRGVLCFEEPENGVHEGRIDVLVDFLREATALDHGFMEPALFQIIINTHSPAVMNSLHDDEIVAADMVNTISGESRSHHTRMRTGVSPHADLFDRNLYLTRPEVMTLLKRPVDAA
jgi:predicted ATPase